MLFQEPKMEFVPIDLSIDATGKSSAGVETCTGPLAPSNLCNYNDTFWLDEYGRQYPYSNVPNDIYTQRTEKFQ